ncbi:hypothetical protein V2L05_26205 [Pseudomonas alliivorans]|nr:hypothetical protein [Pseudomonas alliivorans]
MNTSVSFEVLKEATARDRLELLDLIKGVATNEKTVGYHSDLSSEDEESYFCWLDSTLSDRNSVFIIGRDNDLVVFQLLIAFKFEPNNKHIANLSKAIVHTRTRGKGVIEAVLPLIVEFCDQRRVSIVTLDAVKGSSAERRWKRMGFLEWGVMPHYSKTTEGTKEGSYMYQTVDFLRQLCTGDE